MIRAYAASEANKPLKLTEYEPDALGPGQVEIDVIACGVCHSDLSVLNNEWGFSAYPIIAGHEVVGKIAQVGEHVTHLKVGDAVGLGWYSSSCTTCRQCMAGDHNLCKNAEQTIVGRQGGFAEKVRCSAEWAIGLPKGIDISKAGPLFCGGITVFNPIVQFDVKPTDRVGVIGIGGLGHFALQFLNKWGCEVVAFSSSESKTEAAKQMGAHHVINSHDDAQLKRIAGSLDFIISTANADLDWSAYLDTLGPRGRLHAVGAFPKPMPVPAFSLIPGQKSVSGSPLGSPATIKTMLDFCVRHDIEAITEDFPMSKINDAIEHLASGKARYRVVLENDFD